MYYKSFLCVSPLSEIIVIMDIVMSNSIENLDRTSESLPSESSVNSHNQNDTSNANEGLSKRAQRKLLKRQQWLETRPERRAKEKAKKRAKIEKIRQEKGTSQLRLLTFLIKHILKRTMSIHLTFIYYFSMTTRI